MGALLGEDVIIGNPGDLIFKPRNQWHTFWNAEDTPARVLEIISPAGFEQYFREDCILGPLVGEAQLQSAVLAAVQVSH